MYIDSNGLLTQIRHCPSTHFNERPSETAIDMVVIHGISLPPGQFGSGCVQSFFCGQLDFGQHAYFSEIAHLKVASHLFIDRKGELTQFVSFHKRAWHAGVSYFQGKENCNDFSIGIELEGTDELPYEKNQYIQLSRVINLLMITYPGITRERIVGHSDIAPNRKTDPGAFFDWAYLDTLLEGKIK